MSENFHIREHDRFSLDWLPYGCSATNRGPREWLASDLRLNRIRRAVAELRVFWTLDEEVIYTRRFEWDPPATVRELADLLGQSKSTVSRTEHRLVREIKHAVLGQPKKK